MRNAECAQMFANAGLPNTLIQLITAKQEDDEVRPFLSQFSLQG